jgi:hypothetical protein
LLKKTCPNISRPATGEARTQSSRSGSSEIPDRREKEHVCSWPGGISAPFNDIVVDHAAGKVGLRPKGGAVA